MKYAIAFSLCMIPIAAHGQQMPCADRDDVLAQLFEKYKEAPSAVGVASNGGLIEVLTSTDGATWTIILSMPNGNSCLLSAGEEWHSVDDAPVGTGL